MLDVEIDIDKEILGFDPRPPKFTWVDLVPDFIANFCRRRWDFPRPSPREKWFLALLFVKSSLQILIELDRDRTDPPPITTPDSELN